MKPHLVLALVAVSAVGCADRSFVRADAPVNSDGVTVQLVGQQCGRQAWNEAYDVLDLELVVRVTNGTATAVEIVPAEMRLLASGNAPIPRASSPRWEDAPVQVAPNSTADVRVHFYRRGNARCNQQMQLSLARSVEASGRSVLLPPLTFVPSASDA